MKWLAIMLLLGIGFNAHAEATSAADYFNLGAATFIREDAEAAKAIVEEGLLLHPEDEPLKKLKALLEQQQESQSNKSDQSDSSDQSDPSDSEQDQNQEQDQPQPQEPENQQDQPQEQDQPQPEEMTGEEAEMVLDSLRQLEEAQRDQLMQEMIRRQMRDMPPVEKDW